MTNHLASHRLLLAPNHAGVHGFLPSTIGHTAGFDSVQNSTSADGPQPPLLSATLIGFSIDAEELPSRDSVILEACGQIAVVEENISQTGDVSSTLR